MAEQLTFLAGREQARLRVAEAERLGAEPRLVFGMPDPGSLREADACDDYMRGVREVLPDAAFFYTEGKS